MPQERKRLIAWQWWFGVALACVVLAGAFTFATLNRFARSFGEVEHSHAVLDAIAETLRFNQDAETGQRGFLLTSDPSFLDPYTDAAPRIDAAVARLRTLVADDADQLARTDSLSKLSRQKLDELGRVLAAHRGGDPAGAAAIVRGGAGRRLMDEIRAVAKEMRESEEASLDRRAAAARDARVTSYFYLGTTVVGTVILLSLAGIVHNRLEQRRLDLLRETQNRQRAEASGYESEAKFRVLADTMPQIVWSTRPDGYHDYFNARWYEYTGMPRPDETGGERDPKGNGQGWNWSEYLHPEDMEPSKRVWSHSLATGDPYSVEYRFRSRDGTYRWFIGRALALRDDQGKIVRWFGTCTDIEDQKRALGEREALLAAERAARSAAEKTVRMKDEFVATLSHELRTPLNAILGWTHILRRDRTPENVDRAVEIIDRNARLQSQMVEDLLDTSRILSGKLRLELQRVDLLPVIDSAVASVQPTAEAKGVRLIAVLGSGGPIQGDPGRIQQIIWNLLTNAIKFTPRGGRVEISHRKTGSHVEIVIRDTGQGIKPEFLPHVFERFRQEDASTTRKSGGLGLGLSIVKHLVEMHGGLVEAASAGVGQGATFTVRLPLAAIRLSEPERAPMKEFLPDTLALKNLNVLVIDDEPDARELVKRVLEDAGAKVVAAGSVEEAIGSLQDGLKPDVVVSDIGMPGQDGYEFIRRFRRLDGVGKAPAAALTALARSEDRKRALLAGFQTHVAKPVDPAELVTVVASLSGRLGG